MSNSSTVHYNKDDFSAQDIGIAFALSVFSGLATVVGGAIVFLQRDGQRFDPKKLSGGLSLAAGAILYVVFADLLPEGKAYFAASAVSERQEQLSTLWSTISLFSGAVLMALVSWALHKLNPHHSHDVDTGSPHEHDSHNHKLEADDVTADHHHHHDAPVRTQSTLDSEEASSTSGESSQSASNGSGSERQDDISAQDKAALFQSGISTAVALVLHSLPEGLVTFLATVQDPSVGMGLTVGIAIHNLVEGMSIALPIYFATRNKTKAILTSGLAGLSPVFGALIGFAILETADLNNTMFGVLFGLAGGMLIYIAIKDLLKTAFKYDPNDRVTTVCFFLGMALIALALVILESTGGHGGHGEAEGSDSHSGESDELVESHTGEDEHF